MKLIEYPDRARLFAGLATALADGLAQAIADQGHAALSVPGGTTPGPVFDLLCDTPIDWAKVAVFLNDERWVGEDSPRSNTALIRARLLRGNAAAARMIPLYAPAPQPEDKLDALAQGLAPHLPISVLLLGMGTDMHTASLFPGADRLAQALAPDAPILMALRADAAGEPRITLTAPILRAAKSIHVLITGAEKREALMRALHSPVDQAPIRSVLETATVHWAE